MRADSRYRYLVLWQSLVVSSYRSFFAHLLRLSGAPVTLIAPDSFRELGGQMVRCEPFAPPFSDQGPGHGRSHILRCFSPHVQIALFRGLRQVVCRFLSGNENTTTGGRPVFLCIAEPYSLTALIAWLVICSCKAAGQPYRFITYSAQNIFKRLPLPLALIQRHLFSHCDAILVCGHGQEPVLRRHGFTGPVIYFPLWFDGTRFFPRSRTDAEAVLTDCVTFPVRTAENIPIVRIGYCGSLSEDKGVRDLLKLFSDSRLPPHIRLWIAGDGPLREDVRRADGQVEYVGRLTPEQTSAFMNAIDILIVPSRTATHWKEQFGRVIVEAMACSTIVLGSDSGEIPFVIDDPGRIFHEGDLENLRTLVLRWADAVTSPGFQEEREKSRRLAASFTDEACAARFHAALTELA